MLYNLRVPKTMIVFEIITIYRTFSEPEGYFTGFVGSHKEHLKVLYLKATKVIKAKFKALSLPSETVITKSRLNISSMVSQLATGLTK